MWPLIYLYHSCSAQLIKAYQTANVLFEVLKAVTQQHSVKVDDEVIDFPSTLLHFGDIDNTPITSGSIYQLNFLYP
jgi:hypothetical protein